MGFPNDNYHNDAWSSWRRHLQESLRVSTVRRACLPSLRGTRQSGRHEDGARNGVFYVLVSSRAVHCATAVCDSAGAKSIPTRSESDSGKHGSMEIAEYMDCHEPNGHATQNEFCAVLLHNNRSE